MLADLCMDASTLFRKLSTAIDLISQGKLIRSMMNGETEWQREGRKNKWEKRLITRKPVIDRLSNGEVIELYPDDRLSERIFNRQFEKGEQKFVRQFLRAGDIFVDIGANIGLYTIIVARIV